MNVKIVYKNDKPHGIRDENGFLLFFPKIAIYINQEERYWEEMEEQQKLANYLIEKLKERK